MTPEKTIEKNMATRQQQEPDSPGVTISNAALKILIGLVIGGGGATYLAQPARDLEPRIERIEKQVLKLEESIDTKLDMIDRRISSVLQGQKDDRADDQQRRAGRR